MRKLIVLSAALVLGGFLMSGTAKAEMGCLCTSLGKAACVSGIAACMSGAGVCLLPCDYTAPKKSSKKMSKKKM